MVKWGISNQLHAKAADQKTFMASYQNFLIALSIRNKLELHNWLLNSIQLQQTVSHLQNNQNVLLYNNGANFYVPLSLAAHFRH